MSTPKSDAQQEARLHEQTLRTFCVKMYDGKEYVRAHLVSLKKGTLLFHTFTSAATEAYDAVLNVQRGFAAGSWTEFEEVATQPEPSSVQ